MNTENQTIERRRWMRTALLAYTLASPVIGTWLERMRRRSRSAATPAQAIQETVSVQAKQARDRLEELTQESRQRVVEQVQHLHAQARQLRTQSRQLRKAVRDETKQRRKLLAQLRDAGYDWSQDMLKRGEHLTEDLIERSEKAAHELARRSENIAQTVAERSSEVIHDLAERGEELTQDLAKRSRKMTRDLAERGEDWLQPVRKQNRATWMVAGFGVGLVVAGVITYRLVRGRVAQQVAEEEESIELPQNGVWSATSARPAGEIRHLDQSGTAVATLEVVGVASVERPAGAAFVGIVSTNYYYPIDTELASTDLVYFTTEEEAREQGFNAAE